MTRHKKSAKGRAHPRRPEKRSPSTPTPRQGLYFWVGLAAALVVAISVIVWDRDPGGGAGPTASPTPQIPASRDTDSATPPAAPSWDDDLTRLPPFTPLDDIATSPSQIARSLRREAIAMADLLIRKFPQEPEPYFLMGTLQRMRGQGESALRYWNQGLALEPEHADTFDGMAFLSLERGEYEQALNYWRRALQIAPNLRGVHSGMGRAYMGLGQLENAIEALETEVANQPDDTLNRYLLGQQYFQMRDFARARAQFEKVIEIDPNMTNAYYGLATALARLGEREASREYLDRFQELKDEDFAALEELDRLYDDLAQTRQYAARAHTAAGRLYFLRGGVRLAETVWKRAAELDPQQTDCREFLSLLYDEKGQRELANEYLRQLYALDPENQDYSLTLAMNLYRSGALTEAEQIITDAARRAPGAPGPLREQARMYLLANRNLGMALELAQQIVDMAPTAQHYHLAGWAHESNGNLDEAIASMRRATQLEPANQEYRRILDTLIARKQE